MKVKEFLENIRLTSGSTVNLFLNMHPSNDPLSIKEAHNKALVYVNKGLRELSLDFALDVGAVDVLVTDTNNITINDPLFIELDRVFVDGVPMIPKEFDYANIAPWYERTRVNSFRISPQLLDQTITVHYFKLIQSMVNMEDELKIPHVFLRALENFILKELTGLVGGQEDTDQRAMAYKNWMDSIEDLESRGFQRTSLVSGNLTNDQKGWLEW